MLVAVGVRPRPELGHAAGARESPRCPGSAGRATGIFIAAKAKAIESFSYWQSGLLTPMFLVAGTFFPLDELPTWAQVLGNLNPLYHTVELVRARRLRLRGLGGRRAPRVPDRLRARDVAPGDPLHGAQADPLRCGGGTSCPADPRKPLPHRRGDGVEVGLEAVVAGHRDHLAGRAACRHAERISFALHHERRHLHGVELGLTGLLRAARRMQRERPGRAPRPRRCPPRCGRPPGRRRSGRRRRAAGRAARPRAGARRPPSRPRRAGGPERVSAARPPGRAARRARR